MRLKNIYIFNLLLFFILSSCTQFDRPLPEVEIKEIPPEMEFFGFRRESYITNFKQLDLFATNAKFYNSKSLIDLYDTRAYTYEADGRIAASVSGDLAVINENTLFTKLYTNVIAKASNNTTLFTEYLEWDNEKKYFKSPVPIRAEQDNGNWLTGSGMEGNLDMENVIIYNEVDEGNEIGIPIEEEK